ncbi:MAG: ABC transporter ATP-binding protein [Actinobacteria bacterium]|nr:ABC transporter ATP-binding protein [Actinomycetota bacterium]
MTALLEVDGLTGSYGSFTALHGITLAVQEGEMVAILGANGAGKTTTLRTVSGTIPRRGRIAFGGRDIGRLPPDRIARLGVAHAPEGRGTVAELTVMENLRLGAYSRPARAFRDDLQRVAAYFPWMERRGGQQAGTLSGGEQQMLALGRALMLRPRLLMLDEPSLGLAPIVVQDLYRIVRTLNREEGLAVLTVEQNAMLALESATRAYVLEGGRVALEGSSAELRGNESVRRSYLGY